MLERMREIDAARKAQIEREAQLKTEEERIKAEQREKDRQFVEDVVNKLNPQSLLEQINTEILTGRGKVTINTDGNVCKLEWDEETESDGDTSGERITVIVGANLSSHYSSDATKIPPKYAGIQIYGGRYPVFMSDTKEYFQADIELKTPNFNLDELMPEIETALVNSYSKSHWHITEPSDKDRD